MVTRSPSSKIPGQCEKQGLKPCLHAFRGRGSCHFPRFLGTSHPVQGGPQFSPALALPGPVLSSVLLYVLLSQKKQGLVLPGGDCVALCCCNCVLLCWVTVHAVLACIGGAAQGGKPVLDLQERCHVVHLTRRRVGNCKLFCWHSYRFCISVQRQ